MSKNNDKTKDHATNRHDKSTGRDTGDEPAGVLWSWWGEKGRRRGHYSNALAHIHGTYTRGRTPPSASTHRNNGDDSDDVDDCDPAEGNCSERRA